MINFVMTLLLFAVQVAPDLDPAGDTPAPEPSAAPEVEAPAETPDDGATPDPQPGEQNAEEPAAEESTESAGSSFWESGAIGLLLDGGVFMWPILVMGIVACGVIIERYRSLKMLRTDSTAIRKQVIGLLEQDRVEEALRLCDREQGPVPAILSSGLRKFLVLRRLNYDPAKIEEQVVKAMDDYGVHIVAALEKNLPTLATISSAAPMLGFLGTVAGMITSFEDIQNLVGEMDIVTAAAGGISQALLTTCFGLLVGIPVFMAFNYYSSVINGFVLDVEESATELIETVTLHMALEQQAGVPAS